MGVRRRARPLGRDCRLSGISRIKARPVGSVRKLRGRARGQAERSAAGPVDGSGDALDIFLAGLVVEVLDSPFWREMSVSRG